ncbi:hypothetical protein ACVBEH_26790 [Roseateles sp. GG27B]
MWGMFINSLQLLFKGKLFRDPLEVFKKWLVGLVAATVLLVVLVKVGVALWLAVVLVALGIGALQPWLFRDLKYN